MTDALCDWQVSQKRRSTLAHQVEVSIFGNHPDPKTMSDLEKVREDIHNKLTDPNLS